MPSLTVSPKKRGASKLQNLFIEWKRGGPRSCPRSTGDGEVRGPGGPWVQTTPGDKACCSGSPCTDRKGLVTPGTPRAAPLTQQGPPICSSPERPVRVDPAAKTSANVETHPQCRPRPPRAQAGGRPSTSAAPAPGSWGPSHSPQGLAHSLVSSEGLAWQESPRMATKPCRTPQTQHLRGGPHGALYSESCFF